MGRRERGDTGGLTRTRAQSHPSSPRAVTAFTETTVPGRTWGNVARGAVTVSRFCDGDEEGPYSTTYETTVFSGLGVHDTEAAPPV